MNESLSMDQVFINKLTEIVQHHLSDENFGIEELAREAGMSRSQIHRKLQSITHQSVSQFIREIRLQHAMEMLQQNLGTASEIAFRTGFGSPTYFNKCFHDYYGYPPGEVKKREPLTSEAELANLEPKQFSSDEQLIHKERIKLILKHKRSLIVFGSTILIISIILGFDIFSFFHQVNFEDIFDKDGKIPIAVMPFQNMTNDTTLQAMIQGSLITSLANNLEELRVRQIESITGILQSKEFVNYASITPSRASKISKKLDANVFIIGSIIQSGNTIRLNAQLINSKTKETFKPFQIDGTAEKIMVLSDSLSALVENFLIISILKKDIVASSQNLISTYSAQAYRHYTYGRKAFYELDYPSAINHFQDALDIDSNLYIATIMISYAYGTRGFIDQAKVWCLRAYEKRDQMPPFLKTYTYALHAWLFETPQERIKFYKELLVYDDQNPSFLTQVGVEYDNWDQYEKAIPELEKALEIYDKWDIKPKFAILYSTLGRVYHKTGQYKKEKKLYKKAEQDFPDDPSLLLREAILALSEGKTKAANKYIEKYKSILRNNAITESAIFSRVGFIFFQAGFLDKAEKYFREGLILNPEDAYTLNNLAWILIDKDRNIVEGMELIERALNSNPNNPFFIDTKGWGLFKQGKYDEALKVLEKARETYNPGTGGYIFNHIQEVEKAIASQKTN
jgi:tetratricopeptide (TPR) repeat protein/AraC-like DNA-binding protein